MARVYSSVRSWRSFCNSTTHIATTRAGTIRQPVRAAGGVSSRRSPSTSADTGGGTAGTADIAEPFCLVVGGPGHAVTGEVPKDVLQCRRRRLGLTGGGGGGPALGVHFGLELLRCAEP